MSEETPKPKRRVRYKGTHPRQFKEKYKEHAGDPLIAEKLNAKGKTPVGSHRPIMVNEILQRLAPKPGEIGVDATLGYGGHARELLSKISKSPSPGRLIAFDRDPLEITKTTERLRTQGFGEEVFTPVAANYSEIERELKTRGVLGKIDFLLADLGLSSMQIDDPSRGFTFRREGPLDLRMNPLAGEPASALLARANESEIETWLREHSDEPRAHLLARHLVQARARRPILTTSDLATVIREWLKTLGPSVREREGELPLKRTFQAIRIATNEEFKSLDQFLASIPRVLAPGARIAILSFHSGEDRRVKKTFQKFERDGILSEVSDEAERPTLDEQRANTRSKSAKLRWAIKSRV